MIDKTHPLAPLIDAINSNMMQLSANQANNHKTMLDYQNQLFERLQQPKQVVRDENGKIIGVK
jgi:hypothetical protein